MRGERVRRRTGHPILAPRTSHLTPVGFTLVEVILVAVILAILVTASSPSFRQTAQRLRTEQTAFTLTQLCRYAHEQAVSEGRAVAWVWDRDARRARLAVTDQQGQRQWLGDRAARSEPLSEHVALTIVRDGSEADDVSFFPDGTSQPATLRLTERNLVFTVTIDAATSQPTLSTGAPAR